MDEQGEQTPADADSERPTASAAVAAFARAEVGCPFGPTFFLIQLGRFVRDRCPDPNEGLPVVELHLVSGEVLDVCHIVGVAPKWLVLAVREGAAMATDIVPYELIRRVRVRAGLDGGTAIGFDTGREPAVMQMQTDAEWMSAERALDAAMNPEVAARARDRDPG